MGKKANYHVIAGAVLWGTVGLFVRDLYSAGLSTGQVVFLRIFVATVALLIFVIMTNPRLLVIKPHDIVYFMGTGILSVVFFNWCYFTSIQHTSLAVAAILLYTGPVFVVLLARIFFKENLTPDKIISLMLALAGISLVAGVGPDISRALSWKGLLIGLGSGVGYAFYSIFGKIAISKYHTLTVTTYTFFIAILVLGPTSQIWEAGNLLFDPRVITVSLGLGLIPTVLAYLLYTSGLSGLEAGRAAIMATIEPVVAVLISLVVFKEIFSLSQGNTIKSQTHHMF